MSFKVNVYDPKCQAYASRIKHEEWERHRVFISDLHALKTPRKVMLKRLRDEHNFTPTLGQLQAKCKEWNLKVYAKETNAIKSPVSHSQSPPSIQERPRTASIPAFHLVTESGYVQEWSDDYRVHPTIPLPSHDTTLPPTGLLANTADSHWPLPEDPSHCAAMLQAAHFYHAVNAFQQAFSIYRAVYLYQRRELSVCHPALVRTILLSACSAVTEHQRNIIHSVLCEVGSSSEIDNLNSIYVDCLQAASLSMISAGSGDIENIDQARGRATAHHRVLSQPDADCSSHVDTQAMLYQFEHALLMQEHDTKILHHLLTWCESTVDRLHREVDDIFVGLSRCEEEYHHRVSQVLSGYLLSQWHKHVDDPDEQQAHLMQSASTRNPGALQFHITTTHTLVALAFIIVDAVRCDPLCPKLGRADDKTTRMWFLDAAKLFKRGIRMLKQLDERNRCAVFSETYLARFYSPISYRQKAYHWSNQLPAIVDATGMSLAQQNMFAHCVESSPPPVITLPDEPMLGLPGQLQPFEQIVDHFPEPEPVSAPHLSDPSPMTVDAPSPTSDCNSIASFINTYQRTLKRKFDTRSKSGKSTPGDVMSLTSSADFNLGVLSNSAAGAEVDSLWFVVSNGES